jgi:UDP-2,3-diacylglucosamine pyrophosphatase LpxH
MKDTALGQFMAKTDGDIDRLELKDGDRALILSDLHMGDGGRSDDLLRNERLLLDALGLWYLPRGYFLILNGDIEELQRCRLPAIRERWRELYAIFDSFAAVGKLYKIIGNHDIGLAEEKDYPYKLYESLKLDAGIRPILIYHGHQASRMLSRYQGVVSVALRYLAKPIGIKNISAARSPRRRFFVERQAYAFSYRHGLISIIGHTHRALFESLARFDYIKFEIERLCRDFPLSAGDERERIRAEVRELRRELAKLKRKEKRSSLLDSLYGDEIPVPCLFNSGCAIGKKGITALEIDRERMSLAYWFTDGEGKRFVGRGGYAVDSLEGSLARRTVLNTDRLDYIEARIDLLS